MNMIKKYQLFTNDGAFYQRLFWIVTLFSFLAWFVGLLADPQGHQLDLFHIRMTDFWGDATVVTHFVSDRNPYQDSGTNYPPLPYLVYYVLARVSAIPSGDYSQYYYQPIWTMIFVLFLFINLFLLCYICAKQINKSLCVDAVMIGLSICLSGSMLFALERGNTIIFAVVTTAIYVFYYDSKFKWKKEIALFCLAVSINIKMTPVVFIVLLVCNKDWKALVHTMLYSIILFFLPFFFFDGGLYNIFRMIHNIISFATNHETYNVYSGTGLSSGICHFANKILGEDYEMKVSTYHKLRLLSVVISFILLLGSLSMQDKWKQVLNLTMILMILPPVSHEYNILFFIPASVLFLKSFKEKEPIASSKYPIDKIIVFVSFVMIYFVFRCNISDFLNQRISVWLLMVISCFYSVEEFVKLRLCR